MIPAVGIDVLLLLVLIAFIAGIGITTIGPGGIFVTIGLFLLTPLPAAEVAGTAHATFIATGIVGAVAYRHSGELRRGPGRRMAVILGGSSIIGAVFGAYLNTLLSRTLFGILLGIAAAVTGLVLVRRQISGLQPALTPDFGSRTGTGLLFVVGSGLGTIAGVVGVGGPVFAVPVLVVLGVPILVGLAVAQVQSIFISGFATVGYLWFGAVSWWFVLLVGIPQLLGVVVGWVLAHRLDPDALTLILGLVLVFVGGYLIWV